MGAQVIVRAVAAALSSIVRSIVYAIARGRR